MDKNRVEQRTIADYAMVLELMGRLAGFNNEKKIAESIFELFKMLCGAENVYYIPVHSEKSASVPEKYKDEFLFEGNYRKMKDGFVLRVGSKDTLAFIKIEKIMFREYLENYINIGLMISKVLEISISNARNYQALLHTKKLLRVENEKVRTYAAELEQYKKHLEEIVEERTDDYLLANKELKEEIKVRKKFEEELSRSNRDLQQFANSASQNLLQPLRIIAGYLRLLRMKYIYALDKKGVEYIGCALEISAKMKEMVSDMREFSKIQTHSKPFYPISSAAVLESVLKSMRDTIDKSGARVTCGPMPVVYSNEVLLARLFQNLISNAVKFRGNQPLKINIAAIETSNEWIFSIEDNGIGISTDYKDKIFDMFAKIDIVNRGFGIGLANCKRIMELHGGRIWVESEYGKGSVFKFAIPIKMPSYNIEKAA